MGGRPEWLGQALSESDWVPVKQYVPQNQHPILLSPIREVARGMPRRFDHPQSADLVPLGKGPRHRMSGAGEMPRQLGDDEPRLRHQALEIPCLLGLPISLSAEERNSESLTYGVTAPLVIRMSMGQGMGRELPTCQEP